MTSMFGWVLHPMPKNWLQQMTAADGDFWLKEIGSIVTLIAGLPRKTDALLNRIEQGRLEVKTPETDRRLTRLERSVRSLAAAVVFGAFILSCTQFYLAHDWIAAGFAGGAALVAFVVVLISR